MLQHLLMMMVAMVMMMMVQQQLLLIVRRRVDDHTVRRVAADVPCAYHHLIGLPDGHDRTRIHHYLPHIIILLDLFHVVYNTTTANTTTTTTNTAIATNIILVQHDRSNNAVVGTVLLLLLLLLLMLLLLLLFHHLARFLLYFDVDTAVDDAIVIDTLHYLINVALPVVDVRIVLSQAIGGVRPTFLYRVDGVADAEQLPYLIEISNCELVAIERLYLCDRERGGAVRVFVLRDHVLLSVGGCLLDLLCLGLGNGDGYRAGRVDRGLLLALLLYLLLLGLLLYDLLRLLSDLIARYYRTVAWLQMPAQVSRLSNYGLTDRAGCRDRLLTQTLLPTSITALTWFWGTSVGCSWIDVVYVVLSSLCDTVWGARPWMLRQWAACSSDGSCEWSTLTSPRYTNSSSASRSFALTPASITTGCLHGVFC
uniref:Uncharacterized protein n=1 Tax=Anopheles quadriannulatus TaxID=34691 RepID=A0A182X7R5_ANOQN